MKEKIKNLLELQELDIKIHSIRDELKDVPERLDSLNSKLSSDEQKINNIKNQVSDLDSEVSSLQNQTSDVDSMILKLEEKLFSINSSKEFEAFIYRLQELNGERPDIHRLLTAAVGLSAESGEFTEIVKKIIFQGKPYNDDNVYHYNCKILTCPITWVNWSSFNH